MNPDLNCGIVERNAEVHQKALKDAVWLLQNPYCVLWEESDSSLFTKRFWDAPRREAFVASLKARGVLRVVQYAEHFGVGSMNKIGRK